MLGALLALPTPALAQVTFSAPPECGSQDEFLAEVRALQSAESPPIAVNSVLIAQASPGVYELTLEGPGGRRVLSDGECRTLFRTAVVITAAATTEAPGEVGEAPPPLAPAAPLEASPVPEAPPVVAAQSPAAAAPPPAPVAPPAAVPPPAVDTDQLAAASESTAPTSSAVHFRVAAGGGVATGLSPDAALLLDLGAAVGSNRWGGSLVLKYLPRDTTTTEGDLGLEIETLGGRAGGFLAPLEFMRVEAGVAVYLLTARGTGIRYPDTDSVWLVAPELELMFVAKLSDHWALEFGPLGRIGLTTPTFQVEPETEVFQVPRFGAAVVFRVHWVSR